MKYVTVTNHAGLDICTISKTELDHGYIIDHPYFADFTYDLVQDARDAIDAMSNPHIYIYRR